MNTTNEARFKIGPRDWVDVHQLEDGSLEIYYPYDARAILTERTEPNQRSVIIRNTSPGKRKTSDALEMMDHLVGEDPERRAEIEQEIADSEKESVSYRIESCLKELRDLMRGQAGVTIARSVLLNADEDNDEEGSVLLAFFLDPKVAKIASKIVVPLADLSNVDDVVQRVLDRDDS